MRERRSSPPRRRAARRRIRQTPSAWFSSPARPPPPFSVMPLSRDTVPHVAGFRGMNEAIFQSRLATPPDAAAFTPCAASQLQTPPFISRCA